MTIFSLKLFFKSCLCSHDCRAGRSFGDGIARTSDVDKRTAWGDLVTDGLEYLGGFSDTEDGRYVDVVFALWALQQSFSLDGEAVLTGSAGQSKRSVWGSFVSISLLLSGDMANFTLIVRLPDGGSFKVLPRASQIERTTTFSTSYKIKKWNSYSLKSSLSNWQILLRLFYQFTCMNFYYLKPLRSLYIQLKCEGKTWLEMGLLLITNIYHKFKEYIAAEKQHWNYIYFIWK